MKAKSLWYTAPKKVELREVTVGDPGPHEVRVRLEVCGVCTWDLFIFSGGFQNHRAFPFYFGHEGVGVVEKLGEGVTRVVVGDCVALRESAVIGAEGRGHMAEYAIQSENELIPLPKDDIPDEHWIIEPVACCVNAVDLSRTMESRAPIDVYDLKSGPDTSKLAGGFDLVIETAAAAPEEAQSLYEHGLAKTDGYIKGVIRWG